MNEAGDEMLSAYLDGELTEAEQVAVRSRLADSPEWRAELAGVESVRSLVRGLPVHEPPAELWDSLLEPSGGPSAPAGSARRRRISAARWLTGAAAAAVVATVLLVPDEASTTPPVATEFDQHHAVESVQGEPIIELASVGAPLRPRG